MIDPCMPIPPARSIHSRFIHRIASVKGETSLASELADQIHAWCMQHADSRSASAATAIVGVDAFHFSVQAPCRAAALRWVGAGGRSQRGPPSDRQCTHTARYCTAAVLLNGYGSMYCINDSSGRYRVVHWCLQIK
jgi:hypothetical protein